MHRLSTSLLFAALISVAPGAAAGEPSGPPDGVGGAKNAWNVLENLQPGDTCPYIEPTDEIEAVMDGIRGELAASITDQALFEATMKVYEALKYAGYLPAKDNSICINGLSLNIIRQKMACEENYIIREETLQHAVKVGRIGALSLVLMNDCVGNAHNIDTSPESIKAAEALSGYFHGQNWRNGDIKALAALIQSLRAKEQTTKPFSGMSGPTTE